MRRSIAIFAWLLTGCDGGPDYALPRVADYECTSFDCAIAVGADVDGDAYVGTDVSEYATIASATVEPATLAQISSADHAFTLHALAEGSGMLHIVTTAHTAIDQPIRVAAKATTTVGILDLPSTVDPRGPFDVLGLPAVHVTAVHRDATGARLLGHGLETWAATGATLAELAPDDRRDVALLRDLQLAASPASVTAGGAPLALTSLPPRSTAKLALANDRLAADGVSIPAGAVAYYHVLAFDAGGRFILNPGAPSATSADPAIATVKPASLSVEISGLRIGHTTATVTLDGAEAQLAIDVTQ